MFKNLKIGMKLAVGFGAVLLLTGAIAWIGYFGMEGVLDRYGKTEGVTRISAYIGEARRQEKNFIMRLDEKYIQAVKDNVDKLLSQAEQTKASFKQASNRDEMDRVMDLTRKYFTAFQSYVDAQRDGGNAAKDMVSAGRIIRTLVEEVQSQQRDEYLRLINEGADRERILDKVAKADDAGRLEVWLGQTRIAEKNYMARRDEAYVKEVAELVAKMKALLADLKSRYNNPAHVKAAEAVAGALARYEDAFRRYVEVQKREEVAEEALIENGRATMKQSDLTREDQKTKMDHEIAGAETSMVTGAAVAIFFGVLAAFLITGMIVKALRRAVEAAGRIAEGDLTVRIEADSRDEIGQLLAANT